MKNNRLLTLSLLFTLFVTTSCTSQNSNGEMVLITTDFGNIKVKLYDETPLHKANFLKLTGEGFYNDLLFHRVIKNFMIQGGDPGSKNAQPGVRLGGGSLGYMVNAEFNPNLFHKKGALAAARTGGPSNPEKKSSASQFYIVQGQIFRPGQLDTLEMNRNQQTKNELMNKFANEAQAELQQYKNTNNETAFNKKVAELRIKTDSIFETAKKFTFTEAQRQAYSTVGGTPHLDGDYTVFGEVVEGLDVIDKIAAVEKDQADRPLQDIKYKISIIK